MKPFEDMKHHSTSEQLVNILRDHTQQDDPLFFRLVVGYYFSLVASHMRCTINSPDRGRIPVNMYVLNLAPSGYGKTMSTNLMEGKVLNKFRIRFIEETFPILAEENLPKLAIKRSNRKKTDPDFELENVQKEFERTGNIAFSFDSGTGPAVKQMRHKLLMANAGSMNLIMDEVGANLTTNTEVFDSFIELFDKGLITFNNKGLLVSSNRLPKNVLELWKISKDKNYSFTDQQLQYMEYHSEKVFKGN